MIICGELYGIGKEEGVRMRKLQCVCELVASRRLPKEVLAGSEEMVELSLKHWGEKYIKKVEVRLHSYPGASSLAEDPRVRPQHPPRPLASVQQDSCAKDLW